MSGFCVTSTSITALSHFCGACQCSAGRTLATAMSNESRSAVVRRPIDASKTVTFVRSNSPRTKMRPLSSTVPKRPASSPSAPAPFCAPRFLFLRLPNGAGVTISADVGGELGGGTGDVTTGTSPAAGGGGGTASAALPLRHLGAGVGCRRRRGVRRRRRTERVPPRDDRDPGDCGRGDHRLGPG